ncbi:MSHA biogenesis protein MshJ [Shewanella colwelliana]|uniref:MSHA biogenesis protein MshJ n=1 Tax=Shewanella colwelliana TaxID=23 RepID=UPI0022B06A6E|nr:MSHA biogenesis protein MshJ [Shewanella colwelliana]MCZ4337310.1 MSHA biogenesis protein MshJ [Shewanella colwelliana]
MKQALNQWAEKFDALSQRERVMVAAAVIIVVGMTLYMPLESLLLKRDALQRESKALVAENSISEQQIALYHQKLAQDPDEEYRARLTTLTQQMADIDSQLTEQMVDMVPAERMPAMLSELLVRVKGVKLQSFDSIAPTPLLAVGEENKLNLYSHGIKLVLEGDYFSTVKFIEAVEAMPNKLYWKQLDYSVAQYPKANIVLELYTLSINEDFISVADQG